MHLPKLNRDTWLLAGAVTLVVGLAIVVAFVGFPARRARVASTPRAPARTVAPPPPPTAPPPPPAPPKPRHRHPFIWPIYGFNDARTRVFNGPRDLDDPSRLRLAWKLGGNGPIEFPPVIDGNAVFFMDDNASVNKVDATTGRRWWRKRIGMLSAATPALDVKLGLLFAPILSDTSDVINSRDGSFAAVSMKTGRVVWRDPVASGTETSPLVWGHNVYFGDQGGTMYDVDARTGRTIWSVTTGGAIKGAPTLAHHTLYFGNYAGQLYALNASNGREVWETSVGGGIYASPTLGDGLIFVGSKDSGEMYAFSQSSGHEAWAYGTGSYVYSSAAFDNVPGLGPTVYFGSYNGVAYALNARDGRAGWSAGLGDAISGAASIVNGTVFFSAVYDGYTRGYALRNGAQVFSFDDGAYTATVASPKRVYLCGHYTLYGLVPAH